jgi:hypothetical protein
MNQTSYQQYDFIVKDYANLELEDATIVSDNGIRFDFLDYSEAKLSNTTLDLPAWSEIHFSGHTKTTIQRLTLLGAFGVQFHSQCNVTIENSVIDGVGFWNPGNCNVRFFNSSITGLGITFDHGSNLNVVDIKPSFYDYLDLKEKVSMNSGTPFSLILNKTRVDYWSLEFYYDSETNIQNSTISRLSINIQGISAHLQDLRPQYYEYGQIGKIRLNSTSIEGRPGDIMVRAMDNSEVTVVNSTLGLVATSNSIVHAINSTVSENIYNFFGILDYVGTTCTGMGFFSSSFYTYGNISFLGSNIIYAWFYSNVTRNYGITVGNMTGNFVSNAALTLVSREDALIWNGTTDNMGQADFNLTFTDNNYTDTLKLNISQEGYYNETMDTGFLSDTPVSIALTEKIPGDVSWDRKVGLADLVILAQAYGSKPGDSNWNLNVDIDDNGVVGLSDLVALAQHYGQHYP